MVTKATRAQHTSESTHRKPEQETNRAKANTFASAKLLPARAVPRAMGGGVVQQPFFVLQLRRGRRRHGGELPSHRVCVQNADLVGALLKPIPRPNEEQEINSIPTSCQQMQEAEKS